MSVAGEFLRLKSILYKFMSSQLANFTYLYLFVCIICTSTGVYTNNNNNNNNNKIEIEGISGSISR